MAELRVLVVEDSPTQAEVLRDVLEVGGGHSVTVAWNGVSALAALATESFDAVITDVVMPGDVDGYELCRRIKAGPHSGTPVMLLTSLTDSADVISALAAGADAFARKPYDPLVLLQRLDRLIASRALRGNGGTVESVPVMFLGREVTINSSLRQVADLLVSTFEEAVLQNRALMQREEELGAANARLDRYVGSLERRLQNVVDTIPDVLFSVSPGFEQIRYLSPAALHVFGFTADEMLAHPWHWRRGVHPDDLPALLAAAEQAVSCSSLQSVEHRFAAPNGERQLQLRFVAVHNEKFGTRLDGVVRDVTEQARAHAELESVQRQLVFAQKMEAIGAIAGGVAHDFNNLLGVMKIAAEMTLSDDALPPSLRENLEEIARTVDRGVNLTKRLLAFSRQQAYDVQVVDLKQLVHSCHQMLSTAVGETISIEIADGPEPATVLSDPGQLEQVLMNLCVNARDAMPHGGSLRIAIERERVVTENVPQVPGAYPGDFVRLVCEDNGIGMDEATQSRIFEPFFTTKAVNKGTGLGLSVVYGIVQQHGGFITVKSRRNAGTTFDVHLPFYAAQPKVAAAQRPSSFVGGSETVLLVEDSEELRRSAKLLLEMLGYRVIVAKDGLEGLEVIELHGEEINLVLTDVTMPRLTGPAMRDAALLRRPNLRFLFSSGYGLNAGDLGNAAVLGKPYSTAELARSVRDALDTTPRPVQ